MKSLHPIHLAALMALLLLGSSCTIGRMVVFQFSDIKDYKRFPAETVQPGGPPAPWTQTPNETFSASKFSISSEQKSMGLEDLLQSSNTVAFLVVKGDTIRYERYFEAYDADSWVASFSMAKSFTSALVGIAIHEGKIGSVDEEVVQYIPELKKQGWEGVTIENVLQMTTGVHHAENYFNPFAGVAKSYYGRRLRKQVTRLKLDAAPGTTFGYKSINTQILGEILVRATGKSLTELLREKIADPLGFESEWSWSRDQRRKGIEKAFCCINATARDFARFGSLYLHQGNWKGNQIVPEAWVKTSTKVDEREGSRAYYQYQWWLPSRDGAFSAEGHLGQFIYVHPQKDLVIVRLGKNSGGVDWYDVFGDIAKQI